MIKLINILIFFITFYALLPAFDAYLPLTRCWCFFIVCFFVVFSSYLADRRCSRHRLPVCLSPAVPCIAWERAPAPQIPVFWKWLPTDAMVVFARSKHNQTIRSVLINACKFLLFFWNWISMQFLRWSEVHLSPVMLLRLLVIEVVDRSACDRVK